MRIIKVPNLEYQDYRDILDVILESECDGLLNQNYSAKLETGFFFFWDESYIPDTLKTYIKSPTHTNMTFLNTKIIKIFNRRDEREERNLELLKTHLRKEYKIMESDIDLLYTHHGRTFIWECETVLQRFTLSQIIRPNSIIIENVFVGSTKHDEEGKTLYITIKKGVFD